MINISEGCGNFPKLDFGNAIVVLVNVSATSLMTQPYVLMVEVAIESITIVWSYLCYLRCVEVITETSKSKSQFPSWWQLPLQGSSE